MLRLLWAIPREEKSVHDHHRKKIFWGTFLASKKTFQASGGYKNPIKTRKTISTTEIFPLWTPFFLQRKVLHWSKVVYGFLFPDTPSTAGTFRKKFRKISGKTPETLSERFLEFLSRVRLGCPKPYNSRHLRLPEHFQNCRPPSAAGGASFFRSGSGERLPEPVMEFPAVLGVFLRHHARRERKNVTTFSNVE